MRESFKGCLAGVLLVACLACGAGQTPQAARPPIPVDANQNANPVVNPADIPRSPTCSLLTDEEIAAVQGEAPSAAQGTEHEAGPLVTSQCFYRLNTFEKSISLEVFRAAPGDTTRDAVREYLREKFERAEAEHEHEERRERERERELERERERGGVREGGHGEEEEEKRGQKGPPQRVRGVGDEAFWAPHNGTTALFVRRKGTAFSLALTGPEDRAAKIRKATELARRVLKRLPTEQGTKKARP
jgi:hypothetical protein